MTTYRVCLYNLILKSDFFLNSATILLLLASTNGCKIGTELCFIMIVL